MPSSYFARHLETRLALGPGSPDKVRLVLGARQVGKSTLLQHVAAKAGPVLTLNLQERRLRRRYEADDGLLLRELEAEREARTVFIDEVQKVPGLLDDVQLLHDRDPTRFRFVLTGSSARQLRRGAANLLPGRVQVSLLSPVLVAEIRPAEILPLPLGKEPRFPPRSLEDCLLFGSLPGLFHEPRASWAETLGAYVDLYIEHEIRQENVVGDMGAFVRFLRLAALEAGQAANFTRLAQEVGVAPNTLRNFYQVLEDTHVGLRVPAFTRSRRRILQAPRFLLFDLGVRHVLAGLPLNEALLRLDPGHIFEQWVLAELFYRCQAHGRGFSLSTWRTPAGAEVDAVVETPDEVVPVEVKWTDSPRPADARHVESFLDLHADLAHRGYVVCRCPRRQALTERVTALPWDEF
ncbi:MAG: AAA family ATPase [Pseudomonadota bacterium]